MTLLDEYGLDEGPQQPPRFDAPAVQLETRGITQRKQQREFWHSHTIHKNTVASKLRATGHHDLASKLEHCHTIYTVAVCSGCGLVEKFPNRCDLFCCPECQPRRTSDRQRAVKWWTQQVQQPKHVVLTVKNVADLTRGHVQEFRRWWTNLRRSKFARNWNGGFYSIEVTNEGAGWHLHLHALIDAHWIDSFGLSAAWAKATNNFGRIVKVRDARQVDYLHEVTKYLVKGAQLAAWSPAQIGDFVNAFDGVRTFGVFGNLYGKRTEFAEWFKAIRDEKPQCKCGCSAAHYYTESEFLALDLQPTIQAREIPPPRHDTQTMPLFVENLLPPR